MLLEVCVDSVASAQAAVNGGANRLEVCSNLGLGGGCTPSLGLIRSIIGVVPLTPLMVMVRPRTGDFIYSTAELDVMLEDIRTFKALGVLGLVLGVLTPDGSINIRDTQRLVQEASPLEVTFHRAFDMVADMDAAFEQVASIPGITRILSSGLSLTVLLGIQNISRLFELNKAHRGGRKLTILPGSGIKPSTLPTVLEMLVPLGLTEIHSSCGGWMESGMHHRPEGMGMGVGGAGEWGVWQTSQATVMEIRKLLDSSL